MRTKTYFFPRQALANIFFVLHFKYTWDSPYRVWFNFKKFLALWKRPIFKIRSSQNSQISVCKANFFPRQAIAKILFDIDSKYPWYTPYPVWFDLNNSFSR